MACTYAPPWLAVAVAMMSAVANGTCLLGGDIPDPSMMPPDETEIVVERLTVGGATVSFVRVDVGGCRYGRRDALGARR
ncbi:hypothetical protein ACFO0N_08305 [Halobium salinum]|uniref:Secreted protein n=1 Tax=Halobium salinum TaxID=1364940 RepID=A0ABD5PB92_9EURY|nr:hypothetical protein [Halobium salinum]